MAEDRGRSLEEAVRDEARRAVDGAIARMARAAGAPVRRRPAGPGAASTVSCAEPAAGMGFAGMLAGAACQAGRQSIGYGREHGSSGDQAGQAPGVARTAGDRGVLLAGAALGHVTGAGHAGRRDTLTSCWRCRDCGRQVRDRGPCSPHPEGGERGHAGGCPRLAAAVAGCQARGAGG